MKHSLVGLLCFLSLAPATAQQLVYMGMHFGNFTSVGQLRQFHHNQWQLGGEVAFPLRFTANRLWITAEANGNIGPDAYFELPLETRPGHTSIYDTEIYNSNYNFRSQLRYHFLPKRVVSPFASVGVGYGLLNNSIWVRDPEDSFENCLPLLAEQDFRSRPLFALVGAGLLFNAKEMLERPLGRKVGTGGVLVSFNYLHGPDITVLPLRDHRAGRIPDPNKGIPVRAPFQNPADAGDVHEHQLTTRHQAPFRAWEIRVSLLFCPFSNYED